VGGWVGGWVDVRARASAGACVCTRPRVVLGRHTRVLSVGYSCETLPTAGFLGFFGFLGSRSATRGARLRAATVLRQSRRRHPYIRFVLEYSSSARSIRSKGVERARSKRASSFARLAPGGSSMPASGLQPQRPDGASRRPWALWLRALLPLAALLVLLNPSSCAAAHDDVSAELEAALTFKGQAAAVAVVGVDAATGQTTLLAQGGRHLGAGRGPVDAGRHTASVGRVLGQVPALLARNIAVGPISLPPFPSSSLPLCPPSHPPTHPLTRPPPTRPPTRPAHPPNRLGRQAPPARGASATPRPSAPATCSWWRPAASR
jgi:hypothetical protein